MSGVKIIDITEDNMSIHPQFICFINPKNEYYDIKKEWLKQRFKEGLKIKLLQTLSDNKIIGFIEYVDGNFAWRSVNGSNYLFVHCIWINQNKNRNKGYASMLIKTIINEAKENKYEGVAVVTSDEAFMSDKNIFLKNDFELIDEVNKSQLLALTFNKEKPKVSFNISNNLQDYKGWHIIYTKQCPWVARFIEEVKPIIKKEGIEVAFKELKTAKDAQNAPSIYATFNLIKDGKILSDRYISTTRFLNILKKNK